MLSVELPKYMTSECAMRCFCRIEVLNVQALKTDCLVSGPALPIIRGALGKLLILSVLWFLHL